MEVLTACTMDCPDACSLIASVDGDRVVKMRGNLEHPFTAGFTCKKIKKHLKSLQSPDRIVHPMLRSGHQWRKISWDTALNLCAEKITALRGDPLAIAHVSGSGAKGVNKKAVSLFFDHLGASRTSGSLCDAAGIMAYHYDFGSRRNHPIEDIFNARRIVNWGKGLSRNSIHLAAMVRKARTKGIKVLLISPCQDGDRTFRDQHISIRPGTDRLLAAAIIRRRIIDGAVDANIIERVRHWPAFKDVMLSFDEEALLEACDVSKASADLLYDYYTAQGATATLVSGGLQRYAYGGENVRLINALVLLCGHIGRKGGGSYFHLHSTGHLNMEWAKAPKRCKRRSLQLATIGRDIIEAKDPKIGLLWVNGVNIVNQASNIHQVIAAFEQISFKVVVDAFFNDTASRADLVLPSALMLEQEDIIGSYLHNYIQYIPRVVAPPEMARSDHWIMSELGRRLRPAVELPSERQCMQAALDAPGASVTLDELKEVGYVDVPIDPVAYADLKFDHPDGRARLPLQLHWESPAPETYPLRLLTLAPMETLQSQILPEDQQGFPRIWVAPDCPVLNKIDIDAPTYLSSQLGRIRVDVEFMEDLHPGAVVYRRGDWMALGGGVNQLIADHATNIGGGTAYYHQYVRLENG